MTDPERLLLTQAETTGIGLPRSTADYSLSAQLTFQNALRAAQELGHNHIGTEHLLLGSLETAKPIFDELGVETDVVKGAVDFIVTRGNMKGETRLTPRSRRVVELAVDERKRLGTKGPLDQYDILLGLVREGQGIGATVMESLGMSLGKLRAATIRVRERIAAENAARQTAEQTPKRRKPYSLESHRKALHLLGPGKISDIVEGQLEDMRRRDPEPLS